MDGLSGPWQYARFGSSRTHTPTRTTILLTSDDDMHTRGRRKWVRLRAVHHQLERDAAHRRPKLVGALHVAVRPIPGPVDPPEQRLEFRFVASYVRDKLQR